MVSRRKGQSVEGIVERGRVAVISALVVKDILVKEFKFE